MIGFFPVRRLMAAVATAIAVLVVGGGAAPAQDLSYRSAGSVPVAWKRYAGLVQFRFAEWMGGDGEAAGRLHAFLENRLVAGSEAPEAVVVKAWINGDGTVQRIEFPSLGDVRADADLRTLLTQGSVGEAPPRDMLQPLHLKLSLKWRT